MNELTNQKLALFKNTLIFLWQEIKTLNLKKLVALKNILLSYLLFRRHKRVRS